MSGTQIATIAFDFWQKKMSPLFDRLVVRLHKERMFVNGLDNVAASENTPHLQLSVLLLLEHLES